MRETDAVGEYGERLAIRYLEGAGLEVLARRWRCRAGEIDVVAVDGGRTLVTVEVKTRRSTWAGTPAEAVTPAKLARLRRLTAAWLQEDGRSWPDVRIDVVCVLLPRRGAATVEHLRAVG